VIDRAVSSLGRVEDPHLLAVWGITLECLGDYPAALEKTEESARREPGAQISAVLGRMYTRVGRFAEAMRAFAQAEEIDPRWEMTYVYRGRTLAEQGDYTSAELECRRALSINPQNQYARRLLDDLARRTGS
jgi:tetratricopeptide (TPR) repeat protein